MLVRLCWVVLLTLCRSRLLLCVTKGSFFVFGFFYGQSCFTVKELFPCRRILPQRGTFSQ